MKYDNELNIDYKEGYAELKRYMVAACELLNCTFEDLYFNIQEIQKDNYRLQGKAEVLNDILREMR